MKTSKQKAEELVEKFYKQTMIEDWIDIADYIAIECAKIAVDEIISIYNNKTGQGRMIAICQDDYKYWQEVKNELNKMS